MVIQSVAQLVPILLPSAGEPPVILKDIAGVLTRRKKNHWSCLISTSFTIGLLPDDAFIEEG